MLIELPLGKHQKKVPERNMKVNGELGDSRHSLVRRNIKPELIINDRFIRFEWGSSCIDRIYGDVI
jgi:hypothetical protein